MRIQNTATEANVSSSSKCHETKHILSKMKKGYEEMAAINLSLSKLYFEVESEVEVYYDRATECE